MGANDAAEMLEIAQAEALRLERALISIRDLMAPGRTAEAYSSMGFTPAEAITVSRREIYTVARTHQIRQALAAAGYPVTATPEQTASNEELLSNLAEIGVCLTCGAIDAHFPTCPTTETS